MTKLILEKNRDISVREFERRAANDPNKGEFNVSRDFQVETYIEAKVLNWEPVGSQYKFITGIRVTTCPYDDPGRCAWQQTFADRSKVCAAVNATEEENQRMKCKAHVPRRDRLDIDG